MQVVSLGPPQEKPKSQESGGTGNRAVKPINQGLKNFKPSHLGEKGAT